MLRHSGTPTPQRKAAQPRAAPPYKLGNATCATAYARNSGHAEPIRERHHRDQRGADPQRHPQLAGLGILDVMVSLHRHDHLLRYAAATLLVRPRIHRGTRPYLLSF